MALDYVITGVQDSQETDATGQDTVNTYDVSFAIPSPAYASDVQVPKSSTDVVAAIKAAVEQKVAEVEAIYALSTTTLPAA